MDNNQKYPLIRNSKFQSDYSFKKFLNAVENYTKKVVKEKQPYTIGKTYDEVYSCIYESFKMKWDYENDTIDT